MSSTATSMDIPGWAIIRALAKRQQREASMKPDKSITVIEHDPVNHPSHYRAGSLEALDVIESFGLDYGLGNVIKYVLRLGRKQGADPLQDAMKARFYLDRWIENEQRRRAEERR